MRPLVLTAAILALLVGVAGAATDPRSVAVSELRAAIAEEEKAIALLKGTPPRPNGAAIQLDRSADRLDGVADVASTLRVSTGVEKSLRQTGYIDRVLADGLAERFDPADDTARYVRAIRDLVAKKKLALGRLRTATVPAGTPQCSDGKDNDRDGIVDWTLEPGCTSARDLREQSPFTCDLETRMAAGRLAVSGSCSGAFSELEVTLLDGVQLNGRFDVKHAPSCSPPTLTRVRCTTKDGAQNPRHLVDVRIATTSKNPAQRVRVRFFDARKRRIARVVLPPR